MHQHALTRGPRRRLGDQQGLTLVEVALSAAVLAIIAVGLAASLTQGPRLTRAAQEADAAEYAVRAKIAELSAAPFSEVAAAYNGHDFAVAGLHPLASDPDGMPGEVEFDYGAGGDLTSYTVTISVGWNGVHGERRIRRVHAIANITGDPKLPAPLPTGTVKTGETVESFTMEAQR